ncbi:MAG: presenilin family intramembrane aspartyl protease, partial [Candidatus Paceibacterota bacterium]
MKHNVKITVTIILMFFIAQFIGLAAINIYDQNFGTGAQKARQELIEKGMPVSPMPDASFVWQTVPQAVELKGAFDIAQVVISIVIAVLIAFVLFLFLSRIRTTILIRIWFAFVVFVCLGLALILLLYPIAPTSFFNLFGRKVLGVEMVALLASAILTYYKIVRRNLIVHNFTELLLYSGLAVVFIPMLNWIAAAILLVAISIYDAIAVWKTKHMIKMAKYQIDHLKIFTGFFIPYINRKERIKIQKMKALALKDRKK